MPVHWPAAQQQNWQAQSDLAGTFASLRSLGGGSRQAAPGDHAHNYLNILNYGADKDGVRNSAWAIQAAMTDADNRNMAGVYSPVDGTFLINIALDPPDGMTVAGTGWGTILKMAASTNLTGVFYSTSKRERITIRDLTIDGNSANNASGDGIRMHLKWSHIWRVKFQNIKDKAIYLAPTSVSTDSALLNVVDFCEVVDSTHGIYWDYPLGDSWIIYNNIGSTTANIRGAGGPNRIIGNHCDGSPTYNIQFETAGANTMIWNNLCEGATQNNVYVKEIDYAAGHSADFNISNNLLKNASKNNDNTYASVHIEGFSATKQVLRTIVANNTFITDDAGYNPKYAVYGKHVDGLTIQNNSCQTVGTGYWKLDGTNDHVQIDGNIPENWPETGRITGDVTVTNTAAENAIVSITVGGGNLLLSNLLRVTMVGTYLNNTGATQTLQVKVKYGATTLIDVTTGNITANAASRAWQMVVELSNEGATNVQLASLVGRLGAVSNAASGVGAWVDASVTERWDVEATGTAAIDSTADRVLQITVTHGAANANLTLVMQGATIE